MDKVTASPMPDNKFSLVEIKTINCGDFDWYGKNGPQVRIHLSGWLAKAFLWICRSK